MVQRPPVGACLAVLLATAPLSAQKLTDARTFVPRDHACEIAVDFVALRQAGLWEHLERSLLVKAMDMMQAQLGVRVSDLDRLRAFPETRDSAEREPGQRNGGLVIFEGNDNVGLPASSESNPLKADRIGETEILVEDYAWAAEDPDIYLSPRPGLLVYSTMHLVRPLVEGKVPPGVPSPDFLALTASPGGLAHVVIRFSPKMLADMPEAMQGMNPTADADPVHFLAMRLRQEKAPDADEPTFALELTLRYATGTAAVEPAEKWLRDSLDELGKHPQMGALKRYWRKVAINRDGQDLKARLELGKARQAAADIANLLAPMMMFGMTAEAQPAAVAVPVEAVEVEEPPPPVKDPPKPATEKPKGEGSGKGGGL